MRYPGDGGQQRPVRGGTGQTKAVRRAVGRLVRREGACPGGGAADAAFQAAVYGLAASAVTTNHDRVAGPHR